MTVEREFSDLSEFMQFLAFENNDGNRLPSLAALSRKLGISVATLREQMEVARALGLVEVRPKTGIRRQPYSFTPAVRRSLSYAVAIDIDYYFRAYSDLRNHIERSYFKQAVSLLVEEDHEQLSQLIVRAFEKLDGHPIQIPHDEHRELHILIYRRLNNPFVTGLLEAYWEAYEAVGLAVYTDLDYLKNVWNYHRRIVEAIWSGDVDEGYRALVDHTDLLQRRARPVIRQEFE